MGKAYSLPSCPEQLAVSFWIPDSVMYPVLLYQEWNFPYPEYFLSVSGVICDHIQNFGHVFELLWPKS